MKRVVLTGGGSGGHFYPLIAIGESLKRRAEEAKTATPEIYYMGPDTYDEGSLFSINARFVRIPAGKGRRYISFQNIIDPFKTIGGFFVALWKLYVLYPDVVMSKGGGASLPVVLAGAFLRIPIVVHESDARPGRANRLSAYFAHTIATSYQEVAAYFPKNKKLAYVGVPMRADLFQADPDPFNTLGLSKEKPLVLVIGGSQGAVRINNLIAESLDEIVSGFQILHLTGEKNIAVTKESVTALTQNKEILNDYHVEGFFDVKKMNAALEAASLVISRAGSGTIYEIALHQKPAILIPIPEEISHDQRSNAYAYARTGSATVIEEKNLTPHLLASEITRILKDQELYQKMSTSAGTFVKRDAALQIARILTDIAATHT